MSVYVLSKLIPISIQPNRVFDFNQRLIDDIISSGVMVRTHGYAAYV